MHIRVHVHMKGEISNALRGAAVFSTMVLKVNFSMMDATLTQSNLPLSKPASNMRDFDFLREKKEDGEEKKKKMKWIGLNKKRKHAAGAKLKEVYVRRSDAGALRRKFLGRKS